MYVSLAVTKKLSPAKSNVILKDHMGESRRPGGSEGERGVGRKILSYYYTNMFCFKPPVLFPMRFAEMLPK